MWQRQTVTTVQQHIQVLAAEQRSVDEQSPPAQPRGATSLVRRPQQSSWPCPMKRKLAGPASTVGRGPAMRHGISEARLPELEDMAGPNAVLDDERRQRPAALGERPSLPATVAQLSARLEGACKRPAGKSARPSGKLQPWLAKQGLDRFAGPVEAPAYPDRTGVGKRRWMPCCASAWAALEVSPPGHAARLCQGRPCRPNWRFSACRQPLLPEASLNAAAPVVTCCSCHDAGHKACPHARLAARHLHRHPRWKRRWPLREQLAARRVPSSPQVWPCVCRGARRERSTRQDSEQAGLLARAQEIEHLDKEVSVRTGHHCRRSPVHGPGPCRKRPMLMACQRLVSVPPRAQATQAQSQAPCAAGRNHAPGRNRLNKPAMRRDADRRRPGRGRCPAGRAAGAPHHR